MTQLEFTELAWAGSLFAGFLGSLAGLGGGVVIVPMLSGLAAAVAWRPAATWAKPEGQCKMASTPGEDVNCELTGTRRDSSIRTRSDGRDFSYP